LNAVPPDRFDRRRIPAPGRPTRERLEITPQRLQSEVPSADAFNGTGEFILRAKRDGGRSFTGVLFKFGIRKRIRHSSRFAYPDPAKTKTLSKTG